MPFAVKKDPQNATQNNCKALVSVKERLPDTISNWVEACFLAEVTTSASSQKVQRQLYHTNATYSMQYTRISDEEFGNVLEDR